MLLVSACSTDSCDCEGFEAADFPPTKTDVTIPAVGQVRITESGLDFVESQVPYVLSQVRPEGLSFCIPRDTSGNPDLCVDSSCSNGQNGCQVDLELDGQSITPMPTDTLEVGVTIGDINERLNFDYDAGLFTVNCYVQLFKKGSSESTPAAVAGTIPVRLFVDQASDFNEVGVDIGDASVDLEDIDFKIHGRGNVGDTIVCEGASLIRGTFRGRIEDEVRNALDDVVADVRRSQLCRQCDGTNPCPSGASCTDGVCEYSASQCVPRTLGTEGRLNVGSLIGDFTREPNARVDILAKAADIAQVDTGVLVGLRAGAEPSAVSTCVPVDPTERPPIQAVPASPTLSGDTGPGGDPFMLGIGLHRSAVEQALWSIWSSGATCLEISDQQVMILNSTAFSLVAPSIKDFASNGRSAVLTVVANEFPTVELGANTVTPAGDTYTVDDPLLRILWDDVDFHVFVYAQDRMLRIFTLRLDLDLPVAIVPDGMGNLTPVIPAIEDAIANIEPRRMELLTETPTEIRELVPTLLSLAAPQLAGAIPEAIEVPEFLGFRIDLQEDDITAVDNDEFLGIFASLALANSPVRAMASTAILSHDVSYERVLDGGFVRPEVRLDVRGYQGNLLETEGEYEFSWRVDGGFWSLPVRSNELVIDHPKLALVGTRHIEVRARKVGAPGTTDASPATVDVEIEWAPQQALQMIESRSPSLDPEPLVVEPVVVEPVANATPDPAQPAPQANDRSTNGCQTGPGGLSLFGLLGFIFLVARPRRRRRHRRRLAMLGLVALAAWGCKGGCKGELATNAAEHCFGADCTVDQACETDSDCAGICPEGNSGICEAGACMCVKACEPGCGEDEFCCVSTSECVDISGLCATESSCDPGYEPGAVDVVPNRQTCELDDFVCDCVALPPVPVGWHGPHTSIDSDGSLSVVATYNDKYGDLMLGEISATGEITWHSVDGVPEATAETIVGDPEGPRGGVAERGADVGSHSAVAIAADQTVHLFYRDEDDDVLKWGRATFGGESPTFESEVLDDTEGAGMWTAAAASGADIHVVYAVPELADGSSELRHVVISGGAAAQPVAIVSEPEAESSKSYPRVAGAFADLTATSNGVFLVFWNGVNDRVGRTSFDGTVWAEPQYLAAGTGPWASGAAQDGGLQHVVFQQTEGARYSRFGDTATSQISTGIRDLGDEYWVGTSGEDSSVRIDGSAMTVAHQDAFDRALIVATSADGTSWTEDRMTIDGAATGFWVAMTRRGTPWVADMVIDRRDEEMPAYVRVSPLP